MGWDYSLQGALSCDIKIHLDETDDDYEKADILLTNDILLTYLRNRWKLDSYFKSRSSSLYAILDSKFQDQFGFKLKETTYGKVLEYLYVPKDSSSLAVTRMLFGLAMLFDIPDERGGAVMEKRWGDPLVCHFPLIPFIRAIPMPYMALIYAMLWLGALGITVGYKYRVSSTLFTLSYWYLFLIEKSYWNNHSYLFGVVSVLLTFTQANSCWSIDAYLDPSKSRNTVPYWNYFILKYQFFILYFMAGMKKGTTEWLTGYSVQNLGAHWVFNPFKLFLSVSQTDYLIVHWFVFAFDLTVAMWMMWGRSRHVAMLFCALFHLMNSRLFSIGMFPWVCLATMPLFYPFDWPKKIIRCAKNTKLKVNQVITFYKCPEAKTNRVNNENKKEMSSETDQPLEIKDEVQRLRKSPDDLNRKTQKEEDNFKNKAKDNRNRNLTSILILFHVLSQAFLPYSHFITKGYNNWTKGLYGYSWDMMVHTWDLDSVVVKVVDNTNSKEFYVDPYINSPNDRWTRHGDMVQQYAGCLREKLFKQIQDSGMRNKPSKNISIFVDVWCSMNGRFTQRMFDSKVDMLNVTWTPFDPVSYLMPLLDEALHWRSTLHDIKTDVHSWNNYSDVIFAADFPGYHQEKYISTDLSNVTLTVLNGTVVYEPEVTSLNGHSYKLSEGTRINLDSAIFHKVKNVGDTPVYYMYTFANASEAISVIPLRPKLPIGRELYRRLANMITFARIVITHVFELLFLINYC